MLNVIIGVFLFFVGFIVLLSLVKGPKRNSLDIAFQSIICIGLIVSAFLVIQGCQ
jgi:ABC-type transport system involved in cytochrome c biogenesis permease component